MRGAQIRLRAEIPACRVVTDVAFLCGYRDYERVAAAALESAARHTPNRGPIDVRQIGVGAMPRSAQDHDHQSGDTPRRGPRHARQGSRRQSLIAGLLGVLGFIVLLVYAVLGAGGHAAHAADATRIVHVKPSTIGKPGCEGTGSVRTGVFFVITDVTAATAPASVHVVWSDLSESDVPLLSTQGNNAHYSADFPPGVTGITDATAVVPANWDGQFNVSHHLCGERSTSTPPPSTTAAPPPTTSTPPPSTTTAPPPTTSTPPPPSTTTPPPSTTTA